HHRGADAAIAGHGDHGGLPETGAPAFRGRRNREDGTMIHTRNLPFVAALAIFLLAYVLCILQFPNMLSTRVIGNLLTDNAFLGIAAVGMTFVILSGGIDLSIGSVIAFTSVFVASMVGTVGLNPLTAFAAVLLISTAFGALMGMMIRFLDIPPFVVTLAGMFLARGAAYLIS